MTSKRIKQIVTCAIFAALICVTTMFISVPAPAPLAGNVNLGDAIIIIASFLLGPLFGAIAGGVGAALADLFSAYIVYAPATFFIKAALAVVSAAKAIDILRKPMAAQEILYLSPEQGLVMLKKVAPRAKRRAQK